MDALLREGIEHVFGIPGTQNLAILDELRETPQIRFILTRHEQGAAFMAYGYARAKRAPAAVTATEGPGLTNLATGIAAAYKANVPRITYCGIRKLSISQGCTRNRPDYVHAPSTSGTASHPGKVSSSRKAFRVALTAQGPLTSTHRARPAAAVKPDPTNPRAIATGRLRLFRSPRS